MSFLNFNQFFWNSNNSITDSDSSNESQLFNELKTSSYPQMFEGSGEDINMSLHQSYMNNSFNTIVNTSIVNGNNFTLPCPTDVNFNSSYTRFDIENIYAPNITIRLEDAVTTSEVFTAQRLAGGFQIFSKGYLKGLSAAIYRDGIAGQNSNMRVRIFNSTWSGGNNMPTLLSIGTLVASDTSIEDINGWYIFTFDSGDFLLDPSNTANNTFYIELFDSGDWDMEWYNERDDAGGGDDSDDMNTFYWSSGWVNFTRNGFGTDFSMEVDLAPFNNTPKPSEINLKINSEEVSDTTYAKGYWESFTVNGSTLGELKYNVSADWWDVECNITQFQINFTRTDLKASSSFEVSGSGQEVAWNVTRNGGLNYFDTDFSNYRINFTIPATWDDSSIKVFNGSDIWSINKRLLGNGYREVEVPNAINGTFWFLNATSDNLIDSIDTYVDGVAINDIANYTNIVRFNTTFTEVIKKGNLNLSIYSPAPNYLNHTNLIDISTINPDLEFNVSDWDISNNVTQYGVFITYLAWSNGTAAGFLIGNLTILGETELTFINLPPLIFDASDLFNITAFFNDTGYIGTPPKNISDGIISYSINSNNYRTDNITILGDGLYNITIDCNDTEFNSNGPNSITINASKQYYNNQSETIDIIIIGETLLTIIRPSDGSNFDSSDTFNITIEYSNIIRDEVITNPDINYSLNGGLNWRYDNRVDIGNNKFNITIQCNDTQFGNYGPQTIIVNASKQYYYNWTKTFDITITGNTDLTHAKWPDKPFYYSDETFNVTAYFNDTARDTGISGALITVEVDETQYFPDWEDIGNGYYNITINCSHTIYSNYGHFDLRINASILNYYEASTPSFDLIIGNTTLTVLSPSDGTVVIDRQLFNITILYNDVVKNAGIPGYDVSYSLNEGVSYRTDNITEIGNGQYNITINANHSDFNNNFGFIDIKINASKQNYNNLSTSITIHRQITTSIKPLNNPNLGSVIRGLNISYTFNYSDHKNNPIIGASWANLTFYGFETHLKDWDNGTYTIRLNTSNVVVSSYTYIFNIFAVGNETQTISLTIDITIIETEIENLKWNTYFARNAHLNQTVSFYFNDTTNIDYVPDLKTSDVTVKNSAGSVWDTGDFNWRVKDPWGNGTYLLDISTNGLDSGWYTLQLEVSKVPNYDLSIASITFYLRGNLTQLEIISITDLGGEGLLTGIDDDYTCFEGRDLLIDFNITDLEFANQLVTGEASSYIIRYTEILNTSNNGILSNSISYDANTNTFKGDFDTSNLRVGTYEIDITVERSNYEDSTYSFNLEIKARYLINGSVVYQPEEVTAGDSFIIIIKVQYFNGSIWQPLVDANIIIIPYFDGIQGTATAPITTNSTGEARFEITIDRNVRNMTLVVEIQEAYNYFGDTLEISDITIKAPPSGLAFEDLLPYLIIIGAAVVAAGGSFAVYRGVVVPKKREKTRILTEVKTIFDDAINLEHVLVLYKGTGTCIYFKSFGSDQIDPELISGFISAISSFGKDLVSQEELNEISYGDKMLLLSDGEYIRVALVLSKKASLILRRNLMEFIHAFERAYTNDLPNWRGQLNIFRDAGNIIDEILSTSIILPHEITYEHSSVKTLKRPQSRDVIKIANNLMKDSERNFFFIATLLKEATEKTGQDTAEIFMGIKELRDNKILMPIEISMIEKKPISQQEMNLINQKVGSLVNFSPEERQKIVNDLAQMGPAEREAYFVSLTEQHEIVSAPIESKTGAAVIETIKAAKKEIKNLKKNAQEAKKEKDYDKCMKVYQNAAKIALNWELVKDSQEIDDIMRLTKIEDLTIKMKNLEKEAKFAVKKENFNEAAQKYKISSKIASEIFKLGVTDMTKEVKRLSNKAKEYEKLV